MQIEEIEISKIKEYEQNNKIHGDEQINELVANFKKVGIIDPIFVDENNIILQGHKRLAALKKFGQKKAKIIRVSGLTDSQKSIYRIASNKLTHNSEWNLENLKLELGELQDYQLEELGINFDLQDIEEEKEITEDEIPEVQKDAVSKLGDLWLLGEHRILCGDSLEDWIFKGDLTFTSPPYNRGNSVSLASKNKTNSYLSYDDDNDNFEELLNKSLLQSLNNSTVSFYNFQMLAGNKIELIGWLNSFKENLNDIIIWDKGMSPPAMGENILNSSFEFIFIFENNKKANRRLKTKNFRGTIENVIRINAQRNNEFSNIHAATMPIKLASEIIQRFTNKTEIIIDPFLGCGTTLIAAEQLNRKCYAMELEPLYVDVAIRRWQNLTGKEAIRESDKKTFNEACS